MAQNHKLPGWRYGYTNGFVIVNWLCDETGKKTIPQYYTGSMDYDNKQKAYSNNIENARFYSTEKEARNICKILDHTRDVWATLEKAHNEYY